MGLTGAVEVDARPEVAACEDAAPARGMAGPPPKDDPPPTDDPPIDDPPPTEPPVEPPLD
jgi:hypothetical protein